MPQRIEPMGRTPAGLSGTGNRVGKKGAIGGAVAAMLAAVLAVEGGYVNNKADPGGETNMGITKAVAMHNGYHGPMRALPRDIAEGIYYQQYIVAPGYAPMIPIDAPVTEELFDTAVNMGPPRPSRWFEQSINSLCGTRLAVDGRVGPAVVSAYSTCQARLGPAPLCVAMLNDLDAAQRAEYGRLVRVNPRLQVFYRGWIAHRINNIDRRKCSSGGLS